MGNFIVRADAGRFPHRVAVRIACAIRTAVFRGEGGPSPHPAPAALRAASVPGGLSPQPDKTPRLRIRPRRDEEPRRPGGAGRFPHRVAARIACAIRSAVFRGREDPPRTAPRRRCAPRLYPGDFHHSPIKRPAWESVLGEMRNPVVRGGAGRFPHRVAARIACAIRSAGFSRGGRSLLPPPRRRFAPRRRARDFLHCLTGVPRRSRATRRAPRGSPSSRGRGRSSGRRRAP